VEPGCEWIVDAYGCDPSALRSVDALKVLFDRLIADLRLQPVAEAIWHACPEAGGITGVVVLSESHLTCHTFPERGFAALNLYCCRPRPGWPWAQRLAEALGASDVQVTTQSRGSAVAMPERKFGPTYARGRSVS
jgi:S-adenosylmethionine decarboxylase